MGVIVLKKNENYNSTSDGELMDAVKNNDGEAFTAIYERYNRLLYATAFRFIKEREAAENAVQFVFARLWEYRDEIAVTNNLRNYLFTMTKNYIISQIRSNISATVRNYEIAQTTLSYEDNLIEVLDREHRNELLDEAIAQLPDQKREICRMKRDGRSNQEVADQLDITVNTVKSHYTQAIKMLREYVLKNYTIPALILILFVWLSVK